MRKSYGFRAYRLLELAVYRSLGKLPEPEAAHDFFDEPLFLPPLTKYSQNFCGTEMLLQRMKT
jgi:hypothetical protein